MNKGSAVLSPCVCPQGAAHLQHAGPRVPDRPEHQEELGAHQQARRHRVLLLRQHPQRLPDHQPGGVKGQPALCDVMYVQGGKGCMTDQPVITHHASGGYSPLVMS